MVSINKYNFYIGLGYSHNQSSILSNFTYGHMIIAKAIDMFNNAKENGKIDSNTNFCDHLMGFVTEKDLELNDAAIELYLKERLGYENKPREFKRRAFKSASLFRGCNLAPQSSFGSMRPAVGVTGTVNLDSMTFDSTDLDEFDDEDHTDFAESCCEEAEVASFDCFSAIENTAGSFGNHSYTRAKTLLRTDKYEHIEEKGFRSVVDNPISSFRTTCNTASVDIIRSNHEIGLDVVKSMVKLEELLNYFDYNLDTPNNEKIAITAELCNKPNSNNKLLFLGLKGTEYIPERQNIVILLDVSGSMGGEEVHTQAAIMTLFSKLNDGDKISLITYSSNDEVVIENMEFTRDKFDYIIEKVLKISIYGCTYGSRGLDSAYKLINKNKITDGINRVVIITDGDFNFGTYDSDGIEKLISDKKQRGAYLSVIGTGIGNINDELMNTLAKNGNGNYTFIRSLENVRDNIKNKYSSLMHTIATDVKAQIEFNPKYVKEYRLLGYENREISHSDFKNDKVIAEPFGSGSYAVAVYELVMQEESKIEIKSDLRYTKPQLNDLDELGLVKVRYKDLGNESSDEISKSIQYSVNEMSYNTKLAYIICVIGEILRESKFINDEDINRAETLYKEMLAYGELNEHKAYILDSLLGDN